MDCQFCNNKFSNKQNLNAHQKRAKYCLKIQGKSADKEYNCDSCEKTFLCTTKLRRHQKNCSSKDIVKRLDDRIKELEEKNTLLEERCRILSDQLDKTQERYDNLSLTAVKRPTTSTKNIQINNYIQNMKPLLLEDIKQSVPMLTLEHHVKGPEGYAEFALEFTFKDKIICLDESRDKFKYKNEDGDVIEDIGFRKMMTKLCLALKDRSFNLCQDHYENLSEKFTEEEMKEYNCMETAMAITRYANGRENDFCNKVIKLISKGSKMVKK